MVVAKRLAQRADLDLQVLLRDGNTRPYTAKKLVLGDQRSVGFDQNQK
jgi:hypothetical protein